MSDKLKALSAKMHALAEGDPWGGHPCDEFRPHPPRAEEPWCAQCGYSPEDHDMWAYADDLDAVIAAMGWQPIETAPKDGTEVVLWNDNQHTAAVGSWRRMFASTVESWTRAGERIQPTHWTPLKKPPNGQA